MRGITARSLASARPSKTKAIDSNGELSTPRRPWHADKTSLDAPVNHGECDGRYQNDGTELHHCHADSMTIETSTRVLAMILYLNEVDEGGETAFLNQVTAWTRSTGLSFAARLSG